MVAYDLSHLSQEDSQLVVGPIQDDEALFLYAMIRGMRLKRVLEIGGGIGYSAQSFAHAVGAQGTIYTVDVNPVPVVASNHVCIHKNARDLTREDVHGKRLDLVFFDCHDYDAQMTVFLKLTVMGLITPATVIALHDTNLHYGVKIADFAYELPNRPGCWVHQATERRLVNTLVAEYGYHAFNLHTEPAAHADGQLPVRHGLTLCQKFTELEV
jgi:O-methyltransferase